MRLAKELDQQLPVLRSALAAGDVSLDHAQVIAGSMRRMPAAVDRLTRSAGEELLTRFATDFDPQAIGRLGRHLVHVVDPEHGAALERDEAANELNEAFTMVSGAPAPELRPPSTRGHTRMRLPTSVGVGGVSG